MKKFAYVAMSLALALVCLCAFVACDAGKAGKYKFDSIKVETLLTDPKEYHAGDEFLGVELSKDAIIIELNKDGSFAIKTSDEKLGVLFNTKSGNWKVSEDDSDKIELLAGDKTYATITCKGGKLTMRVDVAVAKGEITFKK